MQKDNRFCLICKPKNRSLYYHQNEDKSVWLYCNKCNRGYSLRNYLNIAGVTPEEFLQGDLKFEDSKSNEVRAMAWPSSFITMSDPRANKGVEYVKSRGLTLDGDMYYDLEDEGIVFPYYFENQFCGAQVRFIQERIKEDGDKWKITTLPGTKLSLLFYNWNQTNFMGNVKGIIVAEGAFNAMSINQSLNKMYGGLTKNPWRAIACSGSGVSSHHLETLKELKDKGYKIICASDTDEAGGKMLVKLAEHESCTHWALVDEKGKDWNDMLKQLGHAEFAKYFISRITPV